MMSKVDNNNDYNYDQALGEKQTGRRQYIIPEIEARIRSLVTESGSEVYFKSEIWHQEVDIGRQIAEQSLIVFDSN